MGASPAEARQIITDQLAQAKLANPDHKYLKGIWPIDKLAGLTGSRAGYFQFEDKIGDAIATFKMHFLDEKFAHAEMTFNSGGFSIIDGAFKSRYGPPSSETETEIQNRAGAKFLNKQSLWKGANVEISVMKYGGTVTEGRATIGDPSYIRHVMEELKKKAAEAGKNF